MQPLPDFDLASDFLYDGYAGNSDPALDAWPWWIHCAARNIAKVIHDKQYTFLVAIQTRQCDSIGGERMHLRAVEPMGTDQRTQLPRPSHFLEGSQKLMTTLSRVSGSQVATEPGLEDPRMWLARFCNSDASMDLDEIRISLCMVGIPLPVRVQQVLWIAQRYNSHRNFREAQRCFDRASEKTIGGLHNYTLQLGLYRLIESLQGSNAESTPPQGNRAWHSADR